MVDFYKNSNDAGVSNQHSITLLSALNKDAQIIHHGHGRGTRTPRPGGVARARVYCVGST